MRKKIWQYFEQPHNSFGKWLSLSPVKAYAPIIGLSIGIIYLLTADWWQQRQQLRLQQSQQKQLQQQLQHQQRLLQSLTNYQQNQSKQNIASSLSLINHKIQQLSQQTKLQIQQNRWLFNPTTSLQLQLIGHFANFKEFLFSLLQQFPQLQLMELQILQHPEKNQQQSILVNLKFNLNKDQR